MPGFRSSGSADAVSASPTVMKPFSAIFRSTSLRRSSAAVGLRNGLYWEGACGSPAIIAASCSSRLRACLAK